MASQLEAVLVLTLILSLVISLGSVKKKEFIKGLSREMILCSSLDINCVVFHTP
jgi:hypothetical protein